MHQREINVGCSVPGPWSVSKTPIARVRPLPDEPTFNYVTRIGLLTGTSSRSRLASELFGVTHLSLIDEGLHGGLSRLSRLLANADGIPMLDLAEKHTMLSLYRPFVASHIYQEALALANNAPGWGFLRLIGARAGVTRHSPAICLDCIEADSSKRELGFAYYRRVHQVKGVTVCPSHGSRLVETCGSCGASMGFSSLPAAHCHACHSPLHPLEDKPSSDSDARSASNYAEIVAACLNGSFPVVDDAIRLAVVRDRIEAKIKNNDFGIQDGLLDCAHRNFGRQHLESLNLSPETWQKSLIQGWWCSSDPIANCIIVAALFDSIDDYRKSVSINAAELSYSKPAVRQNHALQNELELLMA